MKTTLEIHPSFLNSIYLTISERELSLEIRTNYFMDIGEVEGQKCRFNIDEKFSNKLIALTQKVVRESKEDKRIILDGVSLKCGIQTEESIEEYEFRCPELNTPELELVKTYLSLFRSLEINDKLNNYLELLESYFINELPIKEFNENPYRLRIYGSLSIYEKDGLTEIINKLLLNKESLVIDMRNFQNMGTALYYCFEPLKKLTALEIWANNSALEHLTNMGFTEKQIRLMNNDV